MTNRELYELRRKVSDAERLSREICTLEKAVEALRRSEFAAAVIEVSDQNSLLRVPVDASIRNTVTALLEIKLSDSKSAFESLKIIQEAQP